jgi:hypothetical protein
MNQNLGIEALLVIGIGAISSGMEKLEANLTLGIVLVVIGVGLIGYRYFLKTTEE